MQLRTASIILLMMLFACRTTLKRGEFMQWTKAAELPSAHGNSTAVGLAGPVAGMSNGFLIVGGGANFPESMPWEGGIKKYHDDVYLYKFENNRLSIYDRIFKLPYPLAYSANCSGSAGVIVAGGEGSEGITARVMLLSWDNYLNNLRTDTLPSLPEPLTNAAALLVDNILYVAGGENIRGTADNLYKLDLNAREKGWSTEQQIPYPVSHTVFIYRKSDNKLLLAGGRKRNENDISTFYDKVISFDLHKGIWQEEPSLPYAISAGTGVSSDDRLLIFGGDKGETFNRTETLIAAIKQEQDTGKRNTLIQQKAVAQQAHPGFSSEILILEKNASGWKKAGSFPFAMPVTTTAILIDDVVILPSGEIKAGVRTPHIYVGQINAK